MRILTFAGLILVASALTAQSNQVTEYYPEVYVDLSVPASTLDKLVKQWKTLPENGFDYIQKTNELRWIGMTKRSNLLILHVVDRPAGFSFRAVVDRTNGTFRVRQAVDRTGFDRKADAIDAVKRTLVYLDPSRAAEGSNEKPSDAWASLMSGNQRYVAGKSIHPRASSERLKEVAKGQHPIAIVVSCSDSRVPPEIVFDQGLGDLFVVRTAGEVVTEVELGSIEYAVEHLHVHTIVVLGHERCGAVDATIKGGKVSPNIAAIARKISPAVEKARMFGGDLLDRSVRENAKLILSSLHKSEILAEAIEKGELHLQAAYYDLDTGKVEQLATNSSMGHDSHESAVKHEESTDHSAPSSHEHG